MAFLSCSGNMCRSYALLIILVRYGTIVDFRSLIKLAPIPSIPTAVFNFKLSMILVMEFSDSCLKLKHSLLCSDIIDSLSLNVCLWYLLPTVARTYSNH